MSRVTISLEPHLARQLDRLVIDTGHANRSAAVRELIRLGLDRADLIGSIAPTDESACLAHVSFLCSHDEPSISARLIRLLYEHKRLVRNSSRAPIDDDHFLEIVVLIGPVSEVKACADAIVRSKGVLGATVRLNRLDASPSRSLDGVEPSHQPHS